MNYRNNYLVLAFIVVSILTGAAFGQVTPPTGIIAWYAGDGDFRDSSGNGFNASPAAGVQSPTFLAGKVGQDFMFNGNQYASIPDSAAFRPQSLTIEGWAKLTTSVSTRVFLGKSLGSGASNYSYLVYYDGGNISGRVCNSGGCTEISAPFSSNIWHHIAFSYDDPGGAATKTARLYLDGVLVASNTTGGAVGYDTNPVGIGARLRIGDFPNFYWIGGIDEITLYNRALPLAEIESINTAGINGKTKSAATNAGANVQTQVGDATLTFANVSTAGTTSNFTISPPTAGTLPTVYAPTELAYDISTTAAYSGDIQVCFNLPGLLPRGINSLHIFHRENNLLVDRTSSTNVATNTVCANVSSLSQFVVAVEGVRAGQFVYSRLAASASVDSTIWAVFPDGTGDHQITTGSSPRVSPNGNYMVFKRKRIVTTDPSGNYALWDLNLTTGAEIEVYFGGGATVGFDFTPDSSKIIFDFACGLNYINPDGTNFSGLLGFQDCSDDAPVSRPINAMFPNEMYAFHNQGSIRTKFASGINYQTVPNTGSASYFPFWSKDGQFIAYIHWDGSSPHPYYADALYKIKPDGTGKVLLKTLTGTDRFGISGKWSADGTQIYMPAKIGGVTGIYTVATDGSGTISFAPDSANLIAAGTNAEFVGNSSSFAPTAAGVSIGGRVTVGKNGLSRARVTLTDMNGETRTVLTSSFGYYRFDDLEAGETYIVSVNHKRYIFAPQVVSVVEDLTELNFMAEP